jgi:hypothetical protein
VYDIDKMRVYLAVFPAVCIFVAFLFDIGVWRHAKDLKIYDSDAEGAEDEESDAARDASRDAAVKLEKINSPPNT